MTTFGADPPLQVLKKRLTDQKLAFFIDSGLSKNYLSDELNRPLTTIPSLRVMLANGDVLVTKNGISTRMK